MSSPKIRIVCISDTHNAAPGSGFTLPPGDILVHAGDLTTQGTAPELSRALSWIEAADYAAKIVVAGNHDLSLDPDYQLEDESGRDYRHLIRKAKGVVYLEGEAAEVQVKETRIKVFGSPLSLAQSEKRWAFQYPPKRAEEVWEAVPDDVDLLITHTPPKGYVDASAHWTNSGCDGLLQCVQRVKPLLHICGHCHEGRGATVVHWITGEGAAEPAVHWQDPGAGSKKRSLLDLTASRSGYGLQAGSSTAIVNASIMAKSWGRGAKTFNKPIVVDVAFPARNEAALP